MGLRVLSTFSGISAASAAWRPLGYDFAGYCEPAVFPAHVLHQRLGATAPKYLPDSREFDRKKYADLAKGNIVNYGDITQITDSDLRELGAIDVLEGGSPCQSFSVAGLRGGLSDDRGNLALGFVDLALRMKEINGLRFVVWENVTGVLSHGDNPLGCLLAGFTGAQSPLVPPGSRWPDSGHVLVTAEQQGPQVTIAWRVLDAQYFGVPQRRNRVFLVASFDDRIDAGNILFEQAGKDRDPAPGSQPKQAASGNCQAGPGAVTALIGMDSDTTIRVSPDAAYSLKASNHKNVQAVIHPALVGTLCASGAGLSRPAGQGSELDFVIVQKQEDHPNARWDYVCRRLMPVECERLQGFDDGWTDIMINGKPVTDGHRYKALGNSMAVPCMSYIGARLKLAVQRTEPLVAAAA